MDAVTSKGVLAALAWITPILPGAEHVQRRTGAAEHRAAFGPGCAELLRQLCSPWAPLFWGFYPNRSPTCQMMTGWSLHLFYSFSDGEKAQRIDILLAIVPINAIPERYQIIYSILGLISQTQGNFNQGIPLLKSEFALYPNLLHWNIRKKM